VARELTRLQRSVLLSPGAVARTAARGAKDARQRWMLQQPLKVRRSFVQEVLDGDQALDPDRREEIWMLRQAKAVRESYIRQVLGG
jgi:hypothetical protein